MSGPINASGTSAQREADSIQVQRNRPSPEQRWFSLAELALGSAIVIGHNVYRVIPNEVPILFALGLISLRLRDGGWAAMGLRWPVSWRRTVLFALGAAALRILLGALVIDPLTARFWPAAVAPSGSEQIAGQLMVALRWLLIVWTFAAFGEEIGLPGLPAHARGGRGRPIQSCLLGWRFAGLRALRIRTLLQGSVGTRGLWDGWPGSWGRLCLVGTYGSAFWRTGSLTRLEWSPSFSERYHSSFTQLFRTAVLEKATHLINKPLERYWCNGDISTSPAGGRTSPATTPGAPLADASGRGPGDGVSD